MNLSKWITLILVTGLIVGGIWFFMQEPVSTVDVTAAAMGEIAAYVEEQAKTRVPEIYHITMPLDGRILPIELKEGDTVQKNQVVARMEQVDLEKDLQEAISQVKQYDQVLESIDRMIDSSKEQIEASLAKLNYARDELDRNRTLFEKQAVSESDLAAAQLLQTESRVDHTKDLLTLRATEAIRSAVVVARLISVEDRRKAERDLSRAEIRSPVAGTVLNRVISNERVLPAGDVVLEIGELNRLEIEAEILTQQAAEITSGDPVEIFGAAVGSEPVSGRVTRIYPQGFTKVSSLGVEQQRVLVVIEFDSEESAGKQSRRYNLHADYRVRVRVFTDRKDNVLRVPRSAIFRHSDGSWRVFAVRNGRVEQSPVTIGLSNDFLVEVTAGLTPGESVVIAPESSLQDGRRVEMRTVPFERFETHRTLTE